MNTNVTYAPEIGLKQLYFAGDILTVKATVDRDFEGRVFLRSNINQSKIRSLDIINEVENGQPNLDRGWYDTPLTRISPTEFEIKIPLLNVGHFSFKPYLQLNENDQIWPQGDNNFINVEPADYRSDNTVYCAFVRQFGANKNLAETAADEEAVLELDKKGYTVIPPSGKFRDLIRSLDHIIHDLGCRIVHLLPINPTPTTYARMGRYGSPYAALDFTAVNPELAKFDLKATPLEQFLELVDEIHKRQGKLFIDIAINHTGWAAKIHETNPEWLHRHDDGRIHQPGAWGTTWEDLTELDHTNKDLWQYLADVFITWCERGVDGFRCDAGYMIPAPAWTYITAKVRQKFPNAIFLLEGLGGPWAVTEDLLNTANLNWAYSELFQNYSKEQIHEYMKYSKFVSETQGLMIHYAETHDNNRLADKSNTWAKMRTSLSALLSHNGAFGFTNGVEWFAKEKIFVHRSSGLNWGAEENQISHIARMNQLLKNHDAFRDGSTFEFIPVNNDNCLAAVRFDKKQQSPLLVLINLDCENNSSLQISIKDLPEKLNGHLEEFLHSADIIIDASAKTFEIELKPGEANCLGKSFKASEANYNADHSLKLQLMKLLNSQGEAILECDFAHEIKLLKADPLLYFRLKNILTTSWRFPEDTKRHILYTPYSVMVLCCPHRFSFRLMDQQVNSFPADDGKHYALYQAPVDISESSYEKISFIYYGESISRFESDILFLTDADKPFNGSIPDNETPLTSLDTNGRGGMVHLPLSWPNFYSKYDCLLGANLSSEFPENRHIMWRRMRLYCLNNSMTYELNESTMEQRDTIDGKALFTFRVPAGSGRFVRLQVTVGMIEGHNATMVKVERLKGSNSEYLADNDRIELILRPDIEDRNFHMETKAASGIESHWSTVVDSHKHGFTFAPDSNRKLVITSQANFNPDAEWSYNHFQKIEAERGLESHTDIYSPGYLKISLKGGDAVDVLGQVLTENDEELTLHSTSFKVKEKKHDLSSILADGMKHYIVKRGELKTVIAGYPWFLDWGRDTLICVRGIIAAGMTKDVRKILMQFGHFEENGTLPNMIHGGDATNRDTSDAPLWYFVACEDLMKAEGNTSFLDENTGTRTIKEILVSLAENIIEGTPNGIKMDKDSGLVYSPSHFTWMDTNYPAGTPRKGYPVEIQALWYKALTLLAESTDYKMWQELAAKVKENFTSLFWSEKRGFLSDCLHSEGQGAKDSPADDALRCNQLFAVTLGIIDGDIAKQVLLSCEELLIPGAIRSLADRTVDYPLPVKNDVGHLLNDPHNPYWGNYVGDEDTRRKPAYHNGTAWTWPFPSYSEALFMVYGDKAQKHAKAILNSCRVLLSSGCLEQIPEVIDGNAPHRQRGCDAQAWGVTEAYRVWKILNDR